MPRLPHLLLSSLLWLTTWTASTAKAPRIATVDAATLFNGYYRTRIERQRIEEARGKLEEDPRHAVLERIHLELRQLRDEVRNTGNSEFQREEAYRKFQMKFHELRSLQRDTAQHLEARQREVNRQLVTMSETLLDEIRVVIEKVAAREGYDLVLEEAGETSSQVPTLLYIRHATDITALVLKELNKDKPPPGVTPLPPTGSPAEPAGGQSPARAVAVPEP